MNSTNKFPTALIRFFYIAQIIVLAILLTGCKKKVAGEIDFGTFNNSVYHNDYFALTAPLPPDWSIQDQAAQQRLMKAGGKLLAGDDKNMKSLLKASELRVVNLFAVFRHPQGSSVTYNPSLLAVAEDLREFPGIASGKDYNLQAKKFLESSQVEISFPKEMSTAEVGGIQFDVMETEMSLHGTVIKQKYFSAIKKGYALCFIESFTTDEELASVQKILDGISFGKPQQP